MVAPVAGPSPRHRPTAALITSAASQEAAHTAPLVPSTAETTHDPLLAGTTTIDDVAGMVGTCPAATCDTARRIPNKSTDPLISVETGLKSREARGIQKGNSCCNPTPRLLVHHDHMIRYITFDMTTPMQGHTRGRHPSSGGVASHSRLCLTSCIPLNARRIRCHSAGDEPCNSSLRQS